MEQPSLHTMKLKMMTTGAKSEGPQTIKPSFICVLLNNKYLKEILRMRGLSIWDRGSIRFVSLFQLYRHAVTGLNKRSYYEVPKVRARDR
jgi:hypothetical protein